jgi:hypothetical protein
MDGSDIVATIKHRLLGETPSLMKALKDNYSLPAYRDALCHYISSAVSGGPPERWRRELGWVYTGIHLATELIPDYVSVTFVPGARSQDQRTTNYLDGTAPFSDYSFTRFLWPAQESVRNQLITPLELKIETTPAQLGTSRLLATAACVRIDGHRDRFVRVKALRQGVALQDGSGLVVPYEVRCAFREHPSTCIDKCLLRRLEVRSFLRAAYVYIRRTCLRHLAPRYDISPIELCQAFCNTLLLHKCADIDPQTVVFYPLSVGSERIGVFCFVTTRILNNADHMSLRSIAETTLANVYAVDRKLVRLRERASQQSSFWAPMLAHDCRSSMFKASQKVMLAADDLDTRKYDAVATYVTDARRLIDKSIVCLQQLEQSVYSRLETTSTVTPSVLERHMRGLMNPDALERMEFDVRGRSSLRVQMPARRLAEILMQFVHNGLDAVNRSRRRNRRIWCTVRIIAGRAGMTITIADKGDGFTAQQRAQLRAPTLAPLTSTGQGGFGLRTAIWYLDAIGSKPQMRSGKTGTRWTVNVPNAH